MAKNTSILLGDYFEQFINSQVKTGKFSSASEVVRAALRLFEEEETKKVQLVKELIKGEKSGFVKNFDSNSFLNDLQEKYSITKSKLKFRELGYAKGKITLSKDFDEPLNEFKNYM